MPGQSAVAGQIRRTMRARFITAEPQRVADRRDCGNSNVSRYVSTEERNRWRPCVSRQCPSPGSPLKLFQVEIKCGRLGKRVGMEWPEFLSITRRP